MSDWPPMPDPDVPIQDPYYVSNNQLLLAVAIIVSLLLITHRRFFMQFIGENFRRAVALWIIRAAVFVALVSLPLYGYNDLDAFLFLVTGGDPFIHTLTVYSVERFGVIHLSTLMLAACMALAVAMTPVLADWLVVGTGAVVERLQAKMVWEDLEAVEVYDVEEVSK